MHKYDPENDPEKPAVGSEIEFDGVNYIVAKSQYIPASDITKAVMDGRDIGDVQGHDKLLVKDHPTRPFVQYLVWVDRISNA